MIASDFEDRQKEKPKDTRNMNWGIHILPEDCRSLFVFADAELFDQCVARGVIPLHDDRARDEKMRIPCFIGCATTTDLRALEILGGIRKAKQE